MSFSKALPFVTIGDHVFTKPKKYIQEGHHVSTFLGSFAYRDIGIFVMQLNISMCPRIASSSNKVQTWELHASNDSIPISPAVQQICDMLTEIENITQNAPPDTGPRRFGNIAFRKWHTILEDKCHELLISHLPENISKSATSGEVCAIDELKAYLLGSFGSAERLDYGTGHELSFLAFLGCIWKLSGFCDRNYMSDGSVERSIVVGIIQPYVEVMRRLIMTYTLEPAGSHGVWGLDDHFFLSYVFGSAQYCPAIRDGETMPVEGSLQDSPSPGDVANKATVDRLRTTNMYFSAIGFINDVKTGPFWEHSPMLFDISGVRSGWGKINKGMVKMFNAEVLSKFPVVQHFPFGSLFSWEQDPYTPVLVTSVHFKSQPMSHNMSITGNDMGAPSSRQTAQDTIKAPWAHSSGSKLPLTTAPWAKSMPQSNSLEMPCTVAPWAKVTTATPITAIPWASHSLHTSSTPGPTRAPWTSSTTIPSVSEGAAKVQHSQHSRR